MGAGLSISSNTIPQQRGGQGVHLGPLPPSTAASSVRGRVGGGRPWLLVRRWGGAGHGDICGRVPAGWVGSTGSVVLEEREQVIIVVCGEVGWAQVGQQFLGVGQFWEQLGTKQSHQWLWPPTHRTPARDPDPQPALGLSLPKAAL